MRQFRTIALILAGLIIVACEPSVSRAPAPPSPHGTELSERELAAQSFLDLGLVALQDDRLLLPDSDNAFLWFNKALEILPNYERALDGIERVAERYLQLATQAISSDAYRRASTFIDRARSVLPDYPQIALVEGQLERMRNADRRNLDLDIQALKERSPRLAADLVVFGRHARGQGKIVRIFVPNDVLGRWVYEQLSRSRGEQRIRADIVTAPPYRVQILTLDQ